jgi:trk system potassium uptake protein TrkH
MVISLNAAFMLLSACVSLYYGVDTAFYPLLLSGVLTASLGLFPLIFVGKSDSVTMKESYAIVVGAWILACLVGMFPYLLWGGEFTLSSAWFESVSGYTTTGATALTDIESLPKGLLFWRSSTHWLGGMGVVMFALVIMPAIGRTKMTLSSVELSPLARDNYKFKAQKLVRILMSLYLGMTLCETILLKAAGMSLFDALNHSFSTISTGGFSTHTLSIAYFDNRWIEAIIMFFMAVSGIHFGLIYATVTGKRNNIFRSEVTRYYIISFLAVGLFIALSLWHADIYDSFGESLRNGMFQSIATITTTGFAIADTNLWTPLAIILLTVLMFQCACAGSTSGGIKSDRVWLAMRVLRARILQQQHPSAIIRIKLNNIIQDNSVVNFAMFFIVAYLLIVVAGTIIISATGTDLMTSFSMTASCIGNVGPGFGSVGSMSNYAAVQPLVKALCTVFMLLGRLEIFGLIQLFLLKWWR